MIDNLFSEHYHVIDGHDIAYGWAYGWHVFEQMGSPPVDLKVQETSILKQENYSAPLDFGLWPDTKDYDQNNPGILHKIIELQRRNYKSNIEKYFWVNVTRVPICVSYLAACAKVRPATILELGTGGDSAHSTGMFLYWLDDIMISQLCKLVSVDRHPLSHVWPRYRDCPFWHFIQGDSITVMKKLLSQEIKSLPSYYDLIFIDSSHIYPHTLKEIEQASFMTRAILMDDTTVEEVKKSLDEFIATHPEWLRVDLAHGVSLIERHEYI